RLGHRQRETSVDSFQRTETAQSQIEHSLLNSGIIQYFHSLTPSYTDTHLFAGREGNWIDPHGIEVIDPFLGREEIFLFGVAKPKRAQTQSIHTEDAFIPKARNNSGRALRERAKRLTIIFVDSLQFR